MECDTGAPANFAGRWRSPSRSPLGGMDGGVAASATPAPTVPAPFFGLVVAGQPVVTEFARVDANKFSCVLSDPLSIEHLTFFLLPGARPPPCGVVLYYSPPPFRDWRFIGALTCERPSAVFRTRWRSVADLQGVQRVQIGVAVESPEFAANLKSIEPRDDVADVALNVASNLHSFVSSFGANIPADVVDRWIKKFEAKYRRDPTFFLRR